MIVYHVLSKVCLVQHEKAAVSRELNGETVTLLNSPLDVSEEDMNSF